MGSNKKKFSPLVFDWLAVVSLVAVILATWAAPADSPSPEQDQSQIAAVRVEVQRYMGYEILPVRYLSLPYDLTMNANEQVQMLDIGLLLLAFVPVVLVLGFSDKPWMQLAVIASCLLLLVLSTGSGIIIGVDLTTISAGIPELDTYLKNTAFSDAPAGVIVAGIYKALAMVYSGIHTALSLVSGEQDAVTYPLLLLCFSLFFYVARERFAGRECWFQGLSVFVFVYLFFWLMLSSGIVWYGFLMLPLLTLLVFKSVFQERNQQDMQVRVSRYSFYLVLAAWIISGFANRFSNIKMASLNSDPIVGKRLYDPAFVQYQVGDFNETQVVNAFYANLTTATDQMNQELNTLIYNVGTRFNFFIRENDKRIFKDNQLDFFNQLYTKYGSAGTIIPMLKRSGFRYIMVDFNTPTLDNTPEKTLVTRYQTFINYLVNDPLIELISTNRIVKVVAADGSASNQYGIFGEVRNPGSYAVFRIK